MRREWEWWNGRTIWVRVLATIEKAVRMMRQWEVKKSERDKISVGRDLFNSNLLQCQLSVTTLKIQILFASPLTTVTTQFIHESYVIQCLLYEPSREILRFDGENQWCLRVLTFRLCSQIQNCFAPVIQFAEESSVIIWALGRNVRFAGENQWRFLFIHFSPLLTKFKNRLHRSLHQQPLVYTWKQCHLMFVIWVPKKNIEVCKREPMAVPSTDFPPLLQNSNCSHLP